MTRMIRLVMAICSFHISIVAWAETPVIRITDGLEAVQLSSSAYIHKSYQVLPEWGRVGANGLIYVSDGEAVIVDTPWNGDQTASLIDWIENYLYATVTTVIATHWHNDCMGGLGTVIERGIATYACEKTREIAASKSLPVPETGFTDTLSLPVGGKTVECMYPGGGHTVDNIVVHIPGEDILFGGCLIRALGSRSLGSTADAVIEAWPVTVRKVMKCYNNCTVVIPGHGPHGDMSLAVHTLELLETNRKRDSFIEGQR